MEKFTPEETAQIQKWSVKTNPKCPICGESHFHLEDIEYHHPAFRPGQDNLCSSQFDYIPVVILICTKCGYILSFSRSVIKNA